LSVQYLRQMLHISATDYFKDITFLQSIIHSIQEGVVIQNKEGKVISFNEKAIDILHLTADQLLGKTSYDPQWEAIHLDGTAAPGYTHPMSITLRTGEPQNNVIIGVRTGTKNLKWLSVNSRLMIANDETFVFATFTDITKLITSNRFLEEEQEKLKASEEKFSKSFHYSSIGMGIVAPDGRLRDVNDFFCRMVGYTREELLQMSFQDITYPEDLEEDLALVNSMLHREVETYQLEKRYIHKKGHIIWAMLNVS